MIVSGSVSSALGNGTAVVALESSVLSQGLAVPFNREALELMSDGVRQSGAEPAVMAVVRGIPVAGLEGDDLERFLRRDNVLKVSSRDIPWCMAQGRDGATTVAASIRLANSAGIEVFSTGGIGGVHRGAPFDESADLLELSRVPALVVCAGAKSILDLPATMERLESFGVSVVGYRTDEMPGFYTDKTGLALSHSADTPDEIARVWLSHASLGLLGSLLVVQPPPSGYSLPSDMVEDCITQALSSAASAGITGAAVTPFLLEQVERLSGGSSVRTNLALLGNNAKLAGEIATALVRQRIRL